MIHCRELNKDFENQQQMLTAICAVKDKIIKLKKAEVFKSAEKGHLTGILNNETVKMFDIEDGYFYPIINTTKYIDSHLDVHLDTIWNKSVQEQNGKLLYVSDHSLKVADVIAWNEDVEVFTKVVKWSDLGQKYKGDTTALVFKIKVESIINKDAEAVIRSKRAIQNSVRMQYVKIDLAVNSNAKEYRAEKKAWDEHIDLVANKSVAESNGYMWLIKEAKIIKECSMVLFGSNEATPIIYESKELKSENTSLDLLTQKNNILLNLI